MDRRTFLAFVLIFLILTGYPLIMNKFFPQPEKTEPVVAEQVDAMGGMGAQNLDPDEDLPLPVPARTDLDAQSDDALESSSGAVPTSANEALRFVSVAAARDVTVRTPLYTLKISTAGGRIVSWEGMEHDSWLGGPVQLVPENIPPSGSDRVLFRGADLDLGSAVYEPDRTFVDVTGGGMASLTLKAVTAGGLEIRKIFTFSAEEYGMQVDLAVATPGGGGAQALALTGTPERVRFGWNQGIAPTERVQRMELPSLRSVAKVGDDIHYEKRQDLKKGAEKVEGLWQGSVRFAGLQNRYFTVVGVVPQEQGEPVEGIIRVGGDQELEAQSWSIELPARRGVGDEIALARLDLFIGPQQAELLQAYEQGLEKSMDLGWKLFRPLAEVVLWGIEFMHRYIPNYGWIIIIFSILTKLMFYPLTKTSTESMKKMQELQPKLKVLQDKYKNDKEKLNQATMQMYRDEKVNPMSGCLPLLVQSPVFIALYQALSHTISLRGQPFMLWMTDLSQPDAITQLPFSLPFLGSDLNVLPILMSVAMYVQTKLTPTSGASGQMAMMSTMMPLIMVFIFYNMPSGLVLYWLVNTILQGYQTWQIHRGAPASEGAQAT